MYILYITIIIKYISLLYRIIIYCIIIIYISIRCLLLCLSGIIYGIGLTILSNGSSKNVKSNHHVFVKVLCHELIKSYLQVKKAAVIDCLSCDPDNIVWNFLLLLFLWLFCYILDYNISPVILGNYYRTQGMLYLLVY